MAFLRSFFLTLITSLILLHVFTPMPNASATAVKPGPQVLPAGAFQHEIFDGKLYLGASDFSYSPPTNIANAYQFTQPKFLSASLDRQWYGLGSHHGAPRPALILLHGSGRSGLSMIDMWKETAKAENLILIAPNSSQSKGWSYAEDGPDFLQALLTEAEAHYPIDPEQIYIMGHSAGGVLANYVANRSTGPWKAVATHAGALPVVGVIPAKAAIPILNYIGARDQSVSIEGIINGSKALAKAGHPVSVIEVPNHTHWYYRIGPQIAPDIWAALQAANS